MTGTTATRTHLRWQFRSPDTGRSPVSGPGKPVLISRITARCAAGIDHRLRPAPGGTALWLDGWSTWVEAGPIDLPADNAAGWSLSCWIAGSSWATGRASSSGIVAIAVPDGQITLAIDGRGRPTVEFRGSGGPTSTGRPFRLTSSNSLETGAWHRLGVTASPSGSIGLSVGGRVVATDGTGSIPTKLGGPLAVRLGRSWFPDPAHGIPDGSGLLAGLLADVVLGLQAQPVQPEQQPPTETPDLTVPACRFAGDPHRPRLHFMPPQAWMNEPHGAIQLGAAHHLFYQHNPHAPTWDAISWGHATSPDLIRWHHLPPALTPAQTTVAPTGIWSGSSVLDDGRPVLFLTAGDSSRQPDQAIVRAAPGSGDLIRWTADKAPVITAPATVDGTPIVPGQFRDPFVWRENGEWFALVGAGLEGHGGTALLYTSHDGTHWTPEGPLQIGDVTTYPATGVMWELPVLLPVGTGADGRARHVLLVAPWFDRPSEHHLTYVWYWIGTWNPATRTWTPDTDRPRHFDDGAHLTGPSGTVLADGRTILWTIAQDDRSDVEHLIAGWAHNAGLPLQLSLATGGQLSVRPVRELDSYRTNTLIDLTGPSHTEAAAALNPISGPLLDIELEVEAHSASFSLALCRSDDGSYQTVLAYDGATTAVTLDHSRTTSDPMHCTAPRTGPPLGPGPHHLRVIVDHSMIEAYIDDQRSITTRAYAPVGSEGLDLLGTPETRISRLTVHRLAAAHPTDCQQPI